MSLPEKAKEYCKRNRLLLEGDTVVIGFSGGPDSTALALLLAEFKKEGLVKKIFLEAKPMKFTEV